MTNLQKTKQAYAEVDAFINVLPEDKKIKIPQNMREFFKIQKDKEYIKEIDINIPVEEQNLKEETFALIALLYIKYLCEDEEERRNLEKIYAENERKYRDEIKEKYSVENVMQKRNYNNSKTKGDMVAKPNDGAELTKGDIVANQNNNAELTKVDMIVNPNTGKKETKGRYLVEYKESIFKKIINKIKSLFKRK